MLSKFDQQFSQIAKNRGKLATLNFKKRNTVVQ